MECHVHCPCAVDFKLDVKSCKESRNRQPMEEEEEGDEGVVHSQSWWRYIGNWVQWILEGSQIWKSITLGSSHGRKRISTWSDIHEVVSTSRKIDFGFFHTRFNIKGNRHSTLTLDSLPADVLLSWSGRSILLKKSGPSLVWVTYIREREREEWERGRERDGGDDQVFFFWNMRGPRTSRWRMH